MQFDAGSTKFLTKFINVTPKIKCKLDIAFEEDFFRVFPSSNIRGGGGGTPGNSWWEYVIRFSKSWPYFRPKNATSSPGRFALALEVGPGKSALGTRLQKMNPFSDLASKKLCHPYLDQNTSKNHFLKSISNSHISLSFFLVWNWNDKFVYKLL